MPGAISAGAVARLEVGAGVGLVVGNAVGSVRGFEGECANAYFGVFDHLIVQQKPPGGATPAGAPQPGFAFRSRSRRPPLDPVNALLSFLYAMLGHDARAACEAVGLDPQVGFLHRDRPGRAGLALDLMEEFRPYLADRLALSLINRKQVPKSPASRRRGLKRE